ncbi:hypothetical protein [Hyphomicrobium sp. MC1]|uniref:type III secretion apparatus assembly protein SctX n=1 Tax=Hyphomicrobium sp. (strain MC1) TaxID=717785 RepID=UPI000213F22E|nr:hypothetical protein [Hyphomicrobium sp. MC1]CCB66707.1 protein of unknown function [Hyphomicrobium sp. MC1]
MSRISEGDRLLSFNHGLAGVRVVSDVPRLPEDGQAPAIETRPSLQLEALFEARTLDTMLEAGTEPDLADRDVLEPVAFSAALEGARSSLLSLAAGSKDDRRAIFGSALSVLESASEDRGILDMARRTLLKG